jgi:hypothetical protein
MSTSQSCPKSKYSSDPICTNSNSSRSNGEPPGLSMHLLHISSAHLRSSSISVGSPSMNARIRRRVSFGKTLRPSIRSRLWQSSRSLVSPWLTPGVLPSGDCQWSGNPYVSTVISSSHKFGANPPSSWKKAASGCLDVIDKRR